MLPYQPINQYINKKDVRAYNISLTYPIENLFLDNYFCESNDDEQLLIYVPFITPVSIWSISFSYEKNKTHPTCIKLFANKPSMTFIDVDDYVPLQIINILPSASLDIDIIIKHEIRLMFQKFQNINSLIIYIEDNNGDDISRLHSIQIQGKTIKTMDLKKIKKC